MKIQNNKYDYRYDLSMKSSNIRKLFGEDLLSPIDIFSLVSTIPDLTIVTSPMGDNLSGMIVKRERNVVIAINSSMSLGRQRFSLAHELFHLYFDDSSSSAVCFRNNETGSSTERKADKFASYLLIPPLGLHEMIRKLKKDTNSKLTINNIIQLEQFYGVSRRALLSRLVEEGEISPSDYDLFKSNVKYTAKQLGYDDVLYSPLPKERQYNTLGSYIKKVNEIYEKELISNGKYEELLLDAYRIDLVYGEEVEGGEFIE